MYINFSRKFASTLANLAKWKAFRTNHQIRELYSSGLLIEPGLGV